MGLKDLDGPGKVLGGTYRYKLTSIDTSGEPSFPTSYLQTAERVLLIKLFLKASVCVLQNVFLIAARTLRPVQKSFFAQHALRVLQI